MFKNKDSKKLIIVFLALLAIVVIVSLIDRNKGERTLIENLVETDTADIAKIKISGPNVKENVLLEKRNGKWVVLQNGKTFNTDNYKVNSILAALTEMKPINKISVDKEAWEVSRVTDSLGRKIELFNDKKKISELIIGKMEYKPNQNYGYQQNNQVDPNSFMTHVRSNGNKEVYLVKGFLSMTFSPDIGDYRNKKILSLNKNDIKKISFELPVNSSYTLALDKNSWLIDGIKADSLKVDSYLRSISNRSGYTFSDDIPAGDPQYKLVIEGNNIVEPLIISAYTKNDSTSIIHSSVNKDSYFVDDNNTIFSAFFKSKADMVENNN